MVIIPLVLSVRIDDDQRRRQCLSAQMVVENNHIRAVNRGDGVMTDGAAIDTDN